VSSLSVSWQRILTRSYHFESFGSLLAISCSITLERRPSRTRHNLQSYSLSTTYIQSQSYVTTDSLSVSLSWNKPPIWGLRPDFLLLSDNCGFADVGCSLGRKSVSAVYNCCWPSPAQSFSGPSPAGLVTVFCTLRFEITPTWKARSPYLYTPGTGWSSYTSRYWVIFSSPPTTCRSTASVRTQRKTQPAKLMKLVCRSVS
jgi:hypothetical protein